MSNQDFKSRKIPSDQGKAPNDASSLPRPTICEDDPELTEALGIIVSAFVDLAFGTSAIQQASQAANDNRDLIRIAKDLSDKKV